MSFNGETHTIYIIDIWIATSLRFLAMTGSGVCGDTNRNEPHTVIASQRRNNLCSALSVIASLYSGVTIQYFPLFLPTEPVKQS
ncbi:MAG: hypothetical protein LBS73_00485, partial [Campylobacteraceae bacterium]|nr:hypothetical protein [Campylobacteraceae bacterium]